MYMEWLESNFFNTVLTVVLGLVAWYLRGLAQERKETNRRFEAHERRFEAHERRFEAHERRFEASERRFEAHERRLDDLYSSFYGPLMRATKDTK